MSCTLSRIADTRNYSPRGAEVKVGPAQFEKLPKSEVQSDRSQGKGGGFKVSVRRFVVNALPDLAETEIVGFFWVGSPKGRRGGQTAP